MKDAPYKAGPHFPALLQLLRTSETLWNSSRIFFAQWDLSPSQFNILNLLITQPDGLSQNELSRSLLTHRSNVTGLVDRLEARKLIVRKDTPGDRRAYRVVLTPAGRRLVEKILPHFHEIAEQIWGEFPATEADRLANALSQLAANAEALAAKIQNK